jgi:hypothetical protein
MARKGGNLAFRYPGVEIHLHLPPGIILTEAPTQASPVADDSFSRQFHIRQ